MEQDGRIFTCSAAGIFLTKFFPNQNEWAHVKLAVRMFNITLQQRIRGKKALLQELRRQVDDMNVAGRVDQAGRIVFQIEHTKYAGCTLLRA